MVDKNFLAMTNFLSLAANGKCGQISDDIDISAVLKYASEHAVVPLVVSGIQKHGIFADRPIVLKGQEISIQMVARDIQNSFFVKNIFDEFEKKNINYAVLKGDSLSALYCEPEMRISGDIDLLVSEKDENKALKILDTFGYYYEKRPDWGNETVAKHDKYKMIEIHTKLFDDSRKDVFFLNAVDDELQEFIKINTVNYGNISVLSPDDGILFVFLHFVKHFLSSGAGVRQLMDVIVYSKHYINDINWDRFFDLLKRMKYFNLYSYIVSIAVEYLGFSKNELPDVEFDILSAEKVFADLQTGGIFGHNEKELEQFKMVYERERYNAFKEGNYESYKKKFGRSGLKLIFPGLSYMKRKYPYLKKIPALVIFAWIDRIFKAMVKLLSGKRKTSDYLKQKEIVENVKISERMKLMEELGLI